MSAWFGSASVGGVKEAVKFLYPPPKSCSWERRAPDDRSRFSTLLLEHGEKHIQDWAVIAYTAPSKTSSSMSQASPRRSGKTQWAQDRSSSLSIEKNTGSIEGDVCSSMAQNSGNKNSQQYQQQRSKKSDPAYRRMKKKNQHRVDKDTYPSVHMTKIEGRLHLCSQSIVFEPIDSTRPIVRIPFAKMDSQPKEYPSSTDLSAATSTGSFEPMCVEFHSSRHIAMKEKNIIGPFTVVSVATLFRFTFLHSSPSSLVDLCQRLFKVLHQADATKKLGHGMVCPELEDLIRPILERPFDATNLVDVRERPLTSNLRCSLLTPLQSKQGCLVLTTERVYFQAAIGGVASSKSSKRNPQDAFYSYENHTKAVHWLHTNVVATARRYHGLKDCALEIYWKNQTSVLFAFERKHEREQVLRLLPNNAPCHTDRDFVVQGSQAWQKGEITNYEYLLLLNSAAGRTFHDLSR